MFTDLEADGEECEDSEDEVLTSSARLPSFITGMPERESAKRGIATHTVMQFCDFELLEKNGVESELSRLCRLEFLSEEDAKRVRIPELRRFVSSPLFEEMKLAKKLYRELRFNVKLPAKEFTRNEDKKQLLKDSEVLVQGVIDCIIEHCDGSLHLIDYKTDRLTKEERETVTLGEERLRTTHTLQLSYYCDAVKRMFGKAPEKIGIYSLHLGKEVEINVQDL
jgi:ATP-dependent helicase/nuclease subunit A